MKQLLNMFKNISLRNNISLALFIHSLSIISFQIILMRILQIKQWDHFANLIITISMLGFGTSGIIIVLFKQKIKSITTWLVPFLILLSSFSLLTAYKISQNEYFMFDTFLAFSSINELLKLLFFIFLFFIPFLSASLAIGIVYVSYVDNISKLYFSNLTGSGIGGIIALVLLYFMMPVEALYASALLPVIASLFIFPIKKLKLFLSFYAIILLVLIWGLVLPQKPAMSQYKGLSKTMQLPDAKITQTKSGINSLVQIVESDYLRFAPALSLHFNNKLPTLPLAFVNGNASGYVVSYDSPAISMLDFSTFNLPYIISEPKNVAVISSQTGLFVAQALNKQVDKVYAFESDINLIQAVNKWHETNRNSIYENENVNLQLIEARTFMQKKEVDFDLIKLPVIGSFGGISGTMALKENYNMTIESLETYWNNLSDNGLLMLTVYKDFPARLSIKAINSIVTMLKKQGVKKVENHIAAVRSWTTISFVISKQPINSIQLQKIRTYSYDLGFDPFLLPDLNPSERNYFNQINNPELFALTDAIMQNDISVLDEYFFYVTPATDNKPFFYRFVELTKLETLLEKFNWRDLAFIEPGYIIIWITFLFVLLLSIIFILLPVLRFKKSKGKTGILMYFGAIGLAFMFTEIILIQKFILFLGNPVIAVSAVLSTMLIASGIGSYFSSKFKVGSNDHKLIFVIIFVILMLYAFFLTPFLRINASFCIFSKIITTILVIGLPAFLMGMPFPLGIKTVNIHNKEQIAWAWSINGFFSVVAAPLALIIAVEMGSTTVITIASIGYLIAFLGLSIITKK